MGYSTLIKADAIKSFLFKRTVSIFIMLVGVAQAVAEPNADEWHDYLIQDTCRDAIDGNPIKGDPHDKDNCTHPSNLKPGERVFGGFKFSDDSRTYGIWSLPRSSPNGEIGFIHFDSALFGKGTFDLDDPHCKVQGSLCTHDGDTDIVDLVEAKWDSSSNNLVSIIGTAHSNPNNIPGFDGYIGFTSTNSAGTAGSSPDGWLLGSTSGLGSQRSAGIWVYPDSSGTPVLYTKKTSSLDKTNCSTPLGDTPSVCPRVGYNQWAKIDSLYMGHGKTFYNVMLSVHTFSYQQVMSSCENHLELFLHSKEYGLMSHQTWRRYGCSLAVNSDGDPMYPITNLGCDASQSNMIHSPMSIQIEENKSVPFERINCTAAVRTPELSYKYDPENPYQFDPRSFSQPSRQEPYPNAKVVDEAGYGNILLDGNFSWDSQHEAWNFINAISLTKRQAVDGPAPLNQALELHCYTKPEDQPVNPPISLCNDSSIYQDVNIAARAPSMINKLVDFGVRLARLPEGGEATGTVYLWQLDENGVVLTDANGDMVNASKSFTITASEAPWPNPKGQFVESSTQIDSRASNIRFQVFIDKQYHAYMIDDAFVTRRE